MHVWASASSMAGLLREDQFCSMVCIGKAFYRHRHWGRKVRSAQAGLSKVRPDPSSKEALAAGMLALTGVLEVGKDHLTNGRLGSGRQAISAYPGLVGRIPNKAPFKTAFQ